MKNYIDVSSIRKAKSSDNVSQSQLAVSRNAHMPTCWSKIRVEGFFSFFFRLFIVRSSYQEKCRFSENALKVALGNKWNSGHWKHLAPHLDKHWSGRGGMLISIAENIPVDLSSSEIREFT